MEEEKNPNSSPEIRVVGDIDRIDESKELVRDEKNGGLKI